MDTTYVWLLWWVMLFRLRTWTKPWSTLLRYWVGPSETNEQYRRWIRELVSMWVTILWIVADGRKWLLRSFTRFPVQMCQFHMKAIVTRSIGKRPRLDQHREFKDMIEMLWRVRRDTFIDWLESRAWRHADWLSEKNEEWNYKHTKARRALRSVRYHLPHLFTHCDYKDMPATTNSCEWKAAWIKQKANVHRGLIPTRKKKLIDWYLNWSD